MAKEAKEIKVTHAKTKVEINDHVLQEGTTPAAHDPAANVRAFQVPGDAPMPPAGFNMGAGGKLPSEDPAAFAAANPNFPYPSEPMPGSMSHELALHNNYGQPQRTPHLNPGVIARRVMGEFQVEIPDGHPLFANFYHQGMGKYVSRMFSKRDHGKAFLKNVTDFVHNPNNSWFSHQGGWMHPTVTENPMFELINP